MIKLDYVPYIFEKHKVGVFCGNNGSGKIVVEDVFKILYPNDWQEKFSDKLKSIESLSNIKLELYEEFHITNENGIREVYNFCDDANDKESLKKIKKLMVNTSRI